MCLIVSIPDICLLSYFDYQSCYVCSVWQPLKVSTPIHSILLSFQSPGMAWTITDHYSFSLDILYVTFKGMALMKWIFPMLKRKNNKKILNLPDDNRRNIFMNSLNDTCPDLSSSTNKNICSTNVELGAIPNASPNSVWVSSIVVMSSVWLLTLFSASDSTFSSRPPLPLWNI